MTLRALAAAVLLALPSAPLAARSAPEGQGRTLSAPDDPAFEPVLREIEAALPAFDAASRASLRVPSKNIDLGPSARMYRCWKLRLTGDHGKQAHDAAMHRP